MRRALLLAAAARAAGGPAATTSSCTASTATLRALSSTHHHHHRPRPRGDTDAAAARDGHATTLGVFTPVTAQLWIARLKRDQTATAPAQPRAGPVPPTPLTARYPFSADGVVRDLYVNPWGGVRLGRVLEDLDSLAGSVALAHVDADAPGTRPPLLVTASVDAIRVLRPLRVSDGDLVATGQVVYTGGTSMDIRIELGAAAEGGAGARAAGAGPALTATFTFAARDPDTGAPLRVPALDPAALTPREAALFDARRAVAAARRATRHAAAAAAAAPPPPPAVAAEAARLLAATASAADLPALAPRDAVRGGATATLNTFTCQPQQRNISGRIFGGFLMRRAFELAFAGAHSYAGARPHLVDVEEVSFKAPVEVGHLLRLRSRVLHAAPAPGAAPAAGEVVVAVEAHVVSPESASTTLSNTFRFRFGTALAALKRVLPESEADAVAAAEYVVGAADRWADGRVEALVWGV